MKRSPEAAIFVHYLILL